MPLPPDYPPLRCCPFCGAAARLDRAVGRTDPGFSGVEWSTPSVECTNDECAAVGPEGSGPTGRARDLDAIARWNGACRVRPA